VLADGGESDDACLFLCMIYGQDHHDKGQREGRGGGVEECVVARFALCVFVWFVRDEGHTQKSRRRAGGGEVKKTRGKEQNKPTNTGKKACRKEDKSGGKWTST
jgi:hypothetical protein